MEKQLAFFKGTSDDKSSEPLLGDNLGTTIIPPKSAELRRKQFIGSRHKNENEKDEAKATAKEKLPKLSKTPSKWHLVVRYA